MPGRGFRIRFEGLEETVREFRAMADRAEDARPAFEIISDLLQAHTAETVRTRGGRIGERWKPLTGRTVEARRRRWGYYRRTPTTGVGPKSPPLVWTGGMVGSFQKGRKHHVRSIRRGGMEWGSKHPILPFHQSERPRKVIPHRPILGFRTPGQRTVIVAEPLRMWLAGLGPARIRAEAFARTGLAFRRAG